MSLVADEIRDQPRAWSQAIELGASAADALPAGERIAVTGCGSSWHAAKALAALRELGGAGETDAFSASEARLDRGYDRVVAISRSGATTEILRALERVRAGTPTVAVVGDPGSPVAAGCDDVIDLSFADDRSVVQTRFVTTVVCFARAALGLEVGALVADAEGALVRPASGGRRGDRSCRRPRARVAGGPRGRRGADPARDRRPVGRVVPGDGVPPRPDRDGGARRARLAPRPAARPARRRRSPRPGRAWSRRASIRWPSWSGSSASRSLSPSSADWIPTSRRTSSGPWSWT